MRVLLTRPREDSENLATVLGERGMETFIEPLLEIDLFAGPPLDLAGVAAVLATSANGIRTFAGRNGDRAVPVFAVGDASARTAVELGFQDVRSAAGDVETLAALIKETIEPSAGVLLHPAGTKLAGDLGGALEAAGYAYRREVLYEAKTATALSGPARELMAAGGIGGVLLFSPRTGATLASLMTAAGLDQAARSMTAYCLSAAVAERISALPWRAIETAAAPEQAALLALLPDR